MNIFRKIRQDQGLHQSFLSIIGHEVLDGVLYPLIVVFPNFWFAALAWVISFMVSIAVGHAAIEYHDKHDANAHREMSVTKMETWLWE